VDRIVRQRLVERVMDRWHEWQAAEGGKPEQYLSFLEKQGGKEWVNAVWFVALRIALKMGSVEHVGGKPAVMRLSGLTASNELAR
jgi:hypothetical protein